MLRDLPQTFKTASQQIRFLQVAQILNLRHLLQNKKNGQQNKFALRRAVKRPTWTSFYYILSAFSLLLFNLVPRVFSFSSIGKREDPGVEVEKK